jgi:hypothetical protein
MNPEVQETKPKSSPVTRFDLIVLTAILVLSVLMGIVIWKGNPLPSQVIAFSWDDRKVGVEDRYFTINFDRSVDRGKVEKYLKIQPFLQGKISWRGKTLFYTPTEIPVYGTTYQISLSEEESNTFIKPFRRKFLTRDRAFAYIGIGGTERGRLILYNVTQRKKTPLTPSDLIVTDFKIYSDSSKILFSAFEANQGLASLNQQQIYTVTTGLIFEPKNTKQLVGRIERILDAKNYQNLKFDLSVNNIIVIQRNNRSNPLESGLWLVLPNGESRPMGIPGGDFLIAPDGKSVAVTQTGGIAILPLTSGATSTRFYDDFGEILTFSQDGSKQLLVKYNLDYTRSLFLVDKNGEQKELFRSIAPIIGCQFERKKEENIYCIKTDLIEENGKYREEPYLGIINLKTTQDSPLIALPNYRDVNMSMSPDGLGLLFDQFVTTTPSSRNEVVTEQGEAIAAGRIWLLPLPDMQKKEPLDIVPPEDLVSGFKPQWLP